MRAISASRAARPPSRSRSIASASSGVIASVMYRKSMQPTSASGVMSASSFQSGLRSVFAQRSQIALTTAAVARWITPFSGPIQRSCESDVRRRQKPAMSAVIDSSATPVTMGASA